MAAAKPALLARIKRIADDSASPRAAQEQVSVIPEPEFVQLIRLERRRSERSGKPFMLMLLGSEDFPEEPGAVQVRDIAASISACTRETDVIGWYEQDVILGLLLTEIGLADHATVTTITQKVSVAVQAAVSAEEFRRLTIEVRIFPHRSTKDCDDGSPILYPDLSSLHEARRCGRILKRGMDILGSLIAIIALLPAFLLIALLVKLTSEGPVLFGQRRLGQYGRAFRFVKFRSMYVDNDPQIHQEYVAKLISGAKDVKQANGNYKLADDPRITRLGRFLRKTSLDELPQFVSVLLGDMSLVGPRPPLPYEYERYLTWHKRRVLEIKPGLTGLWQIEGRSRTTFDEMVRMDLRYAKMWSLWLDCKILLQTPAAMFSGQGAC
jgi:lipopolysaccharide/colanic/teichoic acid biosynthesis glycosyltransferase